MTEQTPSPEALEAADEFLGNEPYSLKVHFALALDRFAERRVREAIRDCAQYDATMEGPKFKGWNRSALDRLRKQYGDQP